VTCGNVGGGPFGVPGHQSTLRARLQLPARRVAVLVAVALGKRRSASTCRRVATGPSTTRTGAEQTDHMLPDLDVRRVRRWCDARVPEHVRDQVRVECDIAPRHLTVIEARPPWRADFGPEWTRQPIARLRYTKATGTWELFWPDRNSRFHRYDLMEPTPRVEDLLAEVERDPAAIFWG